MHIIGKICEQYEKEGVWLYTKWYELFTDGLYSYMGNIGEYEKSNEMSIRLMRISLTNKRANVLDKNLYNNLWNGWQQSKNEADLKSKETLERCIEICELMKRENYKQFYIGKLT